MSVNTITLTIPDRLYNRLNTLAKNTNQAISEVLLATVESTLMVNSQNTHLPPDVADKLTAMNFFSDQALWEATEPTLSTKQQTQFKHLTQKQATQPLNNAEQHKLNTLLAEYDWSILQRAQAFALLSLRGHTIPDLNEINPI